MAASTVLKFAWLEVTGLCNETCDHCYADSSPKGTHGTMRVTDWRSVIDQLASMGTRDVQFIGGEPTLYPHLPELIKHAERRGLGVEVFSNMTHIKPELWDTFKAHRVKLAVSYYSDTAAEHDDVTHLRGAHKKTRANIAKALELGIPLRGGVIAVRAEQRVREATDDLVSLGVPTVGGDRARAFGRASRGAAPTISDLCGHCAHEKCAVGPNGDVWPCVLGRFLNIGNVRNRPLCEIWGGARMGEVLADIRVVHGAHRAPTAPPSAGRARCRPRTCRPRTCRPRTPPRPDRYPLLPATVTI